jgi:hypothetical protein
MDDAVSVRFFAVLKNSNRPWIVSTPSGGGLTSRRIYWLGLNVTAWPALTAIKSATDDHSTAAPRVPVGTALHPAGGHRLYVTSKV